MDPSETRPKEEEFLLRDHLAIYRTVLANERTLLAYTRTALAMVVVGVSVAQFGDWSVSLWLGWALALGGMVLQCLGLHRYRVTRALIRRAK